MINTLIISVHTKSSDLIEMLDKDLAERHVGYLVFEVSRLFKRRFEEEAKEQGLTLQQFRVIGNLFHSPEGHSQAELAAAVDSDPMTISGVLERLQKRGLIQRCTDPNDSRAKRAYLTDEGVKKFHSTREVAQKLYAQAISDLNTQEQEALIKSLKNVRDQLNTSNTD